MKKNAFTIVELLIVLVIFTIILIIVASIFNGNGGIGNSNEKIIQLLEQEGYSNIVIEGYEPFAGSHDDFHKIGFTAVNTAGNTVHGVVTGDNFKGWTIRRY
jgi:prepilin-type N-terminal cleavage/methylation domain-containing protein